MAQSINIPNVEHTAPIPMGARVGNMVFSSGIMGANPQTGEIHSEHQPRKPLDHGVRKKSLLNYLTTLAQQQQKGPEGLPGAKRARAAHRPSWTA